MSTGTIQKAAPKVFIDIEYSAITVSFVNNAGETLTQGQEVVIEAGGTITKRTAATEFVLGIVQKGGDDGTRVTVNVFASYTAEYEAAATITPGQFVFQNGNKNADDIPIVDLAATGNISCQYCIKGGVAGDLIKVIVLKGTVVVP